MGTIEFLEFRQRYESEMAKDLLNIVNKKQISWMILADNATFYTHMVKYDLHAEVPFMLLDGFMPDDGNALADEKREVAGRLDFLHRGVLYHARFHLILWNRTEAKGMTTIHSTPPLNIKFTSESFSARPTGSTPVYVHIPLFSEVQRLPVQSISAKSIIFEDRLIADTLPALSKLGQISMEFAGAKKISYPGEFKSAGEKRIEFIFNKIPDDKLRFLEAYLEELYNEHSQEMISSSDAKADKSSAKAEAQKQVGIIIRSNDDDYVAELSTLFNDKPAFLIHEKENASFFIKASKSSVKMILIDGDLEDDLWELMGGLQHAYQEREKSVPAVALVSRDLTEDTMVYAQYCNIKHVFNREKFVETACKDIGLAIGHRDWVCSDGEELPSVLIIDDDKNVTFTLEHTLTQEGFSPLVITQGNDGVRMAKKHRPVCILLEIAIRSGDGMDVCRVLKKLPFTRNIPLLILTASRDPMDREKAKALRVEGYLNKPVETPTLIAAIRELIKNTKKKR